MSEPSYPPKWSGILPRAAAIWLPIAAATTGLAGLMYVVVQQELRLGADDPQVALARTAAEHLNAGGPPSAVVPDQRVELSDSLDAFVLIFDASDHLLASSAVLHGQAPDYPSGALDAAHARGEDRVTWQPEPGVRSATVAVPWQGGSVVAGRSLLLSERRIDVLGRLIALGWAGTLAAVALAALAAALIGPRAIGPVR